MAMRSQIYEWDLFRGASASKKAIDLGVPFSIMTEKGNNLTAQASTKATQFIVVDAFGCTPSVLFPGTTNYSYTTDWTSPTGATAGDTYRGKTLGNRSVAGPRAYLQFYINTTGYFKDPDGVPRDGIPGSAAPYPLTEQFNACNERKQVPVYILPTQAWDLKMTCYENWTGAADPSNISATAEGQVQAFFKYTLYDGVDCLIAMKLLEAGIKITPNNVDEYKRNIFENNLS